jgi:hypothetical protein
MPMPTLSFIHKPKAPRWKSIVSSRNPFPLSRVDNTPREPPHPYASPDIIQIHNSSVSFDSVDEGTAQPKPEVHTSPNIRIELDIPSETFDPDWFQTIASPLNLLSNGQAEGSRIAANNLRPHGLTPRREPQSVPIEVHTDDEDDDVDLSTSEDDVLDHLKAMDVSVESA